MTGYRELLQEKLKESLESLKVREYRFETVTSSKYPLFLLLVTKPDLIGFASLDEQSEEKYDRALNTFREVYASQSSKWADFDLSLVLCKTTPRISDEFCSEIEMNPYFCRKFVIDIQRDLGQEIRRLPFVPLLTEIRGIGRPVSAQTFLMGRGVKTDLSRNLVIPYKRSRDGIITDCILGKLGEPKLSEPDKRELITPPAAMGSRVRLKELEIAGFRAYRKARKFNLDADIVVLYGPNGLGKTSFFDAIDFLCTGNVSRFEKRFRGKPKRLQDTLGNLDSSLREGVVRAHISVDGKEKLIVRRLQDTTHAFIGKSHKKNNRKHALMELTGLTKEPMDLRLENFIRLFRSTHLFAQEYQSLTLEEFRKDSRLDKDTVSRMLAFQDYVQAVNKAQEVSEEMARRIKLRQREYDDHQSTLESGQAELQKLSESVESIKEPQSLRTIREQIVESAAKLDISIEASKEFDQDLLKELRMKIAVGKNSLNQSLSIAKKLESGLPQLGMKHEELNTISSNLEQKRELLKECKEGLSKDKRLLGASVKSLDRMLETKSELESTAKNLTWLLQTKEEYEKLKQQSSEQYENHKKIQEQLAALNPRIKAAEGEISQFTEPIKKNTTEVRMIKSSLRNLSIFERSYEGWTKLLERKKEVTVDLGKSDREITITQDELKAKRDKELNDSMQRQTELQKKLENLQEHQSELKTLLDNIESHISNNVCPVCGQIHKSKGILMQKLETQRGIQPKEIGEAQNLLNEAKETSNKLQGVVGALELKLKTVKQKTIAIRSELAEIEQESEGYQEKAFMLGLPTSIDDIPDALGKSRESFEKLLEAKEKELPEQQSHVKRLSEELGTSVKQRDDRKKNSQTIQSNRKQLQSRIDELEGDAVIRKTSLELEYEKIQQDLEAAIKQAQKLDSEIEEQNKRNQELEKKINVTNNKMQALEVEVGELDKNAQEHKAYIEELGDLISKLKLKDPSLDQLKDLQDELGKKLSDSEELESEVTNFEIALDTSQTTAVMASLRSGVDRTKVQLKSVNTNIETLTRWRSHFNKIHKDLETEQDRVLAKYTDRYGPLASIIQSKLRSVYAFGDLSLYPEKGGIAVRVERRGEAGYRPSDYFSGSQMQIAMLSIFLSAALTQTWSSFAPILLDDPVEHFDDLNTYALLELIRSLAIEFQSRHQFIISTCEDRLFRLMHQKFSKMEGSTIFYVFESIGEDGPRVKKL